jgi:hypothetical protein
MLGWIPEKGPNDLPRCRNHNRLGDRCGGHAFLPPQGIRPIIETVPLANAAEAYGRMMRNEARFRIVLVAGQ